MSYVYFIAAPERVKIGFATNPWKRFSKIQSDSPERLEIVGLEEGDKVREIELHIKFAADRVHGEWFNRSQQIADYVAELPTIERDAPRDRPLGGSLGKWMHDNDHDCRSAAAFLGINISTVSRMCAEKHIPRREAMRRIHRLTGGVVSPNSLYGIGG